MIFWCMCWFQDRISTRTFPDVECVCGLCVCVCGDGGGDGGGGGGGGAAAGPASDDGARSGHWVAHADRAHGINVASERKGMLAAFTAAHT